MELNIEIKLIDCGDVKKVDYYIITIISYYSKFLRGIFYDISRVYHYYKWMEKLYRYIPRIIDIDINDQFIHMLEFLEKNNCNLSLEKTDYCFEDIYFDSEVIPLVYKFAFGYMTNLQQEFTKYYLSKGYDRIFIWHNVFDFHHNCYYFSELLEVNYVTKTMLLRTDTISQLLRKLIGNRKIRNHDRCECLRERGYVFKIVEEDNRIVIYDNSCEFYKEAFIV